MLTLFEQIPCFSSLFYLQMVRSVWKKAANVCPLEFPNASKAKRKQPSSPHLNSWNFSQNKRYLRVAKGVRFFSPIF